MLPSLACLAPTSSPWGRPLAGMSDLQLRYAIKKAVREAQALMAKRKHRDQMSHDALQRYMDYMDSLDGTQKDYRAKMDALKAEWDAAKQRHNEVERAVDDTIQQVLELRQELEERGLAEL